MFVAIAAIVSSTVAGKRQVPLPSPGPVPIPTPNPVPSTSVIVVPSTVPPTTPVVIGTTFLLDNFTFAGPVAVDLVGNHTPDVGGTWALDPANPPTPNPPAGDNYLSAVLFPASGANASYVANNTNATTQYQLMTATIGLGTYDGTVDMLYSRVRFYLPVSTFPVSFSFGLNQMPTNNGLLFNFSYSGTAVHPPTFSCGVQNVQSGNPVNLFSSLAYTPVNDTILDFQFSITPKGLVSFYFDNNGTGVPFSASAYLNFAPYHYSPNAIPPRPSPYFRILVGGLMNWFGGFVPIRLVQVYCGSGTPPP